MQGLALFELVGPVDHWQNVGHRASGGCVTDGVHGIHAGDHMTEHGIAIASIEIGVVRIGYVVHHVDVKLTRGAVQVGGTRHGDRSPSVTQTCQRRGFQGNGVIQPNGLFEASRGESTALNHKVRNDAVENRLTIKAVIHILQEVARGDGRFRRFQRQNHLTKAGG